MRAPPSSWHRRFLVPILGCLLRKAERANEKTALGPVNLLLANKRIQAEVYGMFLRNMVFLIQNAVDLEYFVNKHSAPGILQDIKSVAFPQMLQCDPDELKLFVRLVNEIPSLSTVEFHINTRDWRVWRVSNRWLIFDYIHSVDGAAILDNVRHVLSARKAIRSISAERVTAYDPQLKWEVSAVYQNSIEGRLTEQCTDRRLRNRVERLECIGDYLRDDYDRYRRMDERTEKDLAARYERRSLRTMFRKGPK